MGMHLRMCGPCQEVKSQVETLHALGGGLGQIDGTEEEAEFTIPSQPPQR